MRGSSRSRRVAVLVLACASEPYDRLIDTIRDTWASRQLPGVDIFYVYGNTEPGRPSEVLSRYVAGDLPRVEPGGVRRFDDVLIVGCADTIDEEEDCLLSKRLRAFGYLAEPDRYDLIYTVCASSYVNLDEFCRHAESLPLRGTVSGCIAVDGTGTAPFISGASMVLTADVARELARNAENILAQNQYGFRDDVAIGHWIAGNLSEIPIDELIEDVHEARPFTRKHMFLPTGEKEIDLVMKPSENHRPAAGAYHYHFHSRRSDDMRRFHDRYFARTGRPAVDLRQSIRYVQIFGERCSGTNYLARLVEKNFEHVEITKSFGGKHWFIKDHEPRGRPNRSTDTQCVRSLAESDDTLFLVIFRDPLDWLRSLHAKPYHAPEHWELPFSEFIRKPWRSYELERVNESWPESERGHYFIEEAENVVRLRSQKIQHLANLERVVPNVAFVRYEALLEDLGTLEQIADRFGIGLRNRPLVDEAFYFGGDGEQAFSGPRDYPPISRRNLRFIRRHLDCDLEASIGYDMTELRPAWRRRILPTAAGQTSASSP